VLVPFARLIVEMGAFLSKTGQSKLTVAGTVLTAITYPVVVCFMIL